MTGRIVSRTGRSAVFPSWGLILVCSLLLVVAFWAPDIGTRMLSALLGVMAIFLGTVMGVVQVTVQTAAGARMLGAGAASVQFSRSLGAAVGTALIGTVLFSTLSTSDAQAARLFQMSWNRGRRRWIIWVRPIGCSFRPRSRTRSRQHFSALRPSLPSQCSSLGRSRCVESNVEPLTSEDATAVPISYACSDDSTLLFSRMCVAITNIAPIEDPYVPASWPDSFPSPRPKGLGTTAVRSVLLFR